MITEQRRNSSHPRWGLSTFRLPDHPGGCLGPRYVSAGQAYRTSRPVTARPMIMRWISEVPSKMVKILASRCQRSTG
jgi:hypothetical protein